MVVRLSVLCTGHLCPQEILLVLISVRGWVDPRAMVRSERLCQRKNPKTPSGIEPVTFPNRKTNKCHLRLSYRGADKSLARPTSPCRRTEAIFSLQIHAILIEILVEHAPSYATVKTCVGQFKSGDFFKLFFPGPAKDLSTPRGTMDHYGAFDVFYQDLTSNLQKPYLFFATPWLNHSTVPRTPNQSASSNTKTVFGCSCPNNRVRTCIRIVSCPTRTSLQMVYTRKVPEHWLNCVHNNSY
jgi:hypothetical protein